MATEWEELVDDESGRTYYHHRSSGATQWDAPSAPAVLLPAGWIAREDAAGQTYYEDTISGKAQWDVPVLEGERASQGRQKRVDQEQSPDKRVAPDVRTLLRKASDLHKQKRITAAKKSQLKDLIVSGEPETLLQAAVLVDSLDEAQEETPACHAAEAGASSTRSSAAPTTEAAPTACTVCSQFSINLSGDPTACAVCGQRKDAHPPPAKGRIRRESSARFTRLASRFSSQSVTSRDDAAGQTTRQQGGRSRAMTSLGGGGGAGRPASSRLGGARGGEPPRRVRAATDMPATSTDATLQDLKAGQVASRRISILQDRATAEAALLAGKRDSIGGPLHRAARAGNADLCYTLLQCGADADDVNDDGWTALVHSAVGGHVEVARALLKAGASIDKPASSGSTALIYAAINSKGPMVKFLLDSGADPTRRNSMGHTVLDHANKKIAAIVHGHS